MPADHGLLRVALAAVGQALALALADHDLLNAFNNSFTDFFDERCSAGGVRLVDEGLDGVVLVLLVGDQLRGQRLAEL